MSTIVFIALITLMAATVIVLLLGVITMVRGGEANQKYGNKMMVMRVALQAGALLLLAVLFFLSNGKGA